MDEINQPNQPVRRPETMEEALAPHQSHARAVQETSAAAVLATCMGKNFGPEFKACAFKAYRDNMLQAAGRPTDPIEVMLIEQLLWAHHRLGDLHADAACAKTIEAAEAYNSAAVRLMAEIRKTSLALREYRTPVVPKNVTVVKQQNVAAGDQQIAYVDSQTPRPGSPNNRTDIEVGSKQQEALVHEQHVELLAQPQAGRGREAELVEARPIDAARPRAVAASGPCESTMGAVHRPANGVGEGSVGGQRPSTAERREVCSPVASQRGERRGFCR